MRRFRRRQRRYTWFPPIGNGPALVSQGVPTEQQFLGPITDAITVRNSNLPSVGVYALTFDYPYATPIASAGVLPSLVDVTSTSWYLERLVGKCFVQWTVSPEVWASLTVPTNPAALITAGIMVLRVDDLDAGPVKPPVEYSPDTAVNIPDPWVWRRSWILGNGLEVPQDQALNAARRDLGGYPPTTAHYGSIQDGPHIDTKSNRLIGPEERLFFVIAGRNHTWDVPPEPGTDNTVLGSFRFHLDYRILGSVRRSTNRGNTSR